MSSIGRPRGLSRLDRATLVGYCRWPDCGEPRHDASDAPPLCTNHLIECASYMARAMQISILDPAGEMARTVSAIARQATDESVVYYVRLADHIKIGTTTNLKSRLEQLYVAHDPDLLLATEPGGREVEKERHGMFAAERVFQNRELFNPSPRLLAHIKRLNERAA